MMDTPHPPRPAIGEHDLMMAMVSLRRTHLLPDFAVRPRDGAVMDVADVANPFGLFGDGFVRLDWTDVGETCVDGCFHFWRDIPHGKWAFMHPSVLIGKGGCAVCRGKRVAAKREAKAAKRAAKKAEKH